MVADGCVGIQAFLADQQVRRQDGTLFQHSIGCPVVCGVELLVVAWQPIPSRGDVAALECLVHGIAVAEHLDLGCGIDAGHP